MPILSALSSRPLPYGVACATLACALWGFPFLAPKLLLNVHPVLLTAGRYGVYALLALLLSVPRWESTKSILLGPHGKVALGLSIMSNTVYFTLLAAAVQWSSPAVVGVIIGTLPVWVSMIGRERGSPITPLLLPLGLIASGVGLINWQALHSLAHHLNVNFFIGTLAAFAATACWTAYSVLNSRYLKLHRDIGQFDWTNVLAFTAAAPLFLVLPVLWWWQPTTFNLGDRWSTFLWISALLGIGSSWAATYLWNAASRALPTTLTGQLIVIETVFVLIFGFAYDGRWPSAQECLAILLCISGVVMAVRQANGVPH
jgi:drug/metabolite transporter (DMT)-like permease